MKFFRDTSISYKILIPPVIMIVALGTVLLLAIHGLNKQGDVLSQVHDIALERITLVNEFISLSKSVESDLSRITVLRFMNVPEPEIQPSHEHLGQGLSDMSVIYSQILSKWPLEQEEKKILQQMKVPMGAFTREVQQATEVVLQNPSFGIFLVRSAAVPFADFQRLLSQFLDYQKRKIAHAETVSRETVETVRTTIIVIALFTALIAILCTIWIGWRFISSPVRAITAAMGQLADGDLSAEIGDLSREDEIGFMAKAVEVFRGNAIEKRSAEERIKTSLQEKEVLLREIHHRVKNNMQVITSLLRLQSDKIKDPKYADMFQESQERIKSMALIHERLYQSKDLARIDFREYAEALIKGLFRSHGVDSLQIVPILAIEDVSLGLDRAIPCGLIINELVSNSLKYAFPGDRKGEISVTLRSTTEREIELKVSDDGIGIPADLDIVNTGSLGLDLVTILAEDQLEGKMDLDRTGGTTFRILFKEKV